MITTQKVKYIEDNIYIPEIGEYTDDEGIKSKKKVIEVTYNRDLVFGEQATIVHEDHYYQLAGFILENLGTHFLAVENSPYTTTGLNLFGREGSLLVYRDDITKELSIVGRVDVPIISLETNRDCFIEGSALWKKKDLESLHETVVYRCDRSLRFSSLYIEMPSSKNKLSDPILLNTAQKTASNVFNGYDDNKQILRVSLVKFFDMPLDQIVWLDDKHNAEYRVSENA